MDFIAEIVLGYVDYLLTEELEKLNIVNYKILRYRDDYKVFTNNPFESEQIAKKFEEHKKLGFALVSKFFMIKNKKFSEDVLEQILPKLKLKNVDELYAKVAEGTITRNKIFELIYPSENDSLDKPSSVLSKVVNSEKSVAIDGILPGMAINFANCCNPIPGDDIVGIINTGVGVTIHNQECRTLRNLIIKPQKIIEVHWKDNKDQKILYSTRIKLLTGNKAGNLSKITSIIAKKKININNMRVMKKGKDFSELLIDIEVYNCEQIESLVSALVVSKHTNEVKRVYC